MQPTRHCGLFAAHTTLLVPASGAFDQDKDTVLIRDPRANKYADPVPAYVTAPQHWEFAAMSANAYQEGQISAASQGTAFVRTDRNPLPFSEEGFTRAFADEKELIPLQGWTRWDFPGPALQARMKKEGMYMEVLERTIEPHTVVVIFEGTNFKELKDWKANLRWFLRFLPGYTDQYTLAANDAALEFLDHLQAAPHRYTIGSEPHPLRNSDGNPVQILATGHSLGGGLAQQFAYSFAQRPRTSRGPKVAKVFAFDPSPVTGWFSTANPPRDYNAEGLVVERIFEHGEILAYLRLLTSRFAITSKNPEIWEYRYNFDSCANIIKSHSMHSLACGLARLAKPWQVQ
jgi:hypothetical protein